MKRETVSGQLVASSLYRKPVSRGILGKEFRFNEVDSSTIDSGISHKNQVPDNLFKPSVKLADDKYMDLLGKGRPSWPSMSPLAATQLVFEQRLVTILAQRGLIAEASKTWKSIFLKEGQCFVDAKGAHFLSSANLVGMAVLVPLVKVRVGKRVCMSVGQLTLDAVRCEP